MNADACMAQAKLVIAQVNFIVLVGVVDESFSIENYDIRWSSKEIISAQREPFVWECRTQDLRER